MTEPGTELPEGLPPGAWADDLEPGERLLWEGRPAAGLRLGPEEQRGMGLGLGLAITGVVFYFMADVEAGEESFARLGLGILAVGLVLMVAAVLRESWRRRTTRYALTDRRALVARHGLWRTLRSDTIRPDSEITLHPGAEATIHFARRFSASIGFASGHSLPVARNGGVRADAHGFERIADGERVYALMRAIQRRAAAEAP